MRCPRSARRSPARATWGRCPTAARAAPRGSPSPPTRAAPSRSTPTRAARRAKGANPDACAQVVGLRAAAGDEPTALVREAEAACKGGARDDAAKRARAAACLTLAEARVKGGAAPEGAAAARAHHQACEASAATRAARPRRPTRSLTCWREPISASTSITSNGMKLDEVACKVSGLGGMFGAMTVVASFSPRKGRLDACAKTKTEVVVKWVGKGGAMTDIRASGGPPPVNACVERALAGSKVALAGPCAARFQVH